MRAESLRSMGCTRRRWMAWAKAAGRLLAFAALPAWSHHSALAVYDMNKEVTIEGVVTQFHLVNPHASIDLEVTDAAGKVQTWSVELDAASTLKREGWTNDRYTPGMRLIVKGRPARASNRRLAMQSISEPGKAADTSGNLTGDDAKAAEFVRQADEWRREQRKRRTRPAP